MSQQSSFESELDSIRAEKSFLERRQGTDRQTLERLFAIDKELLPLWIAEPNVALADGIVEALERRASTGWYGYEVRPESVLQAFWRWMSTRHGWDGAGLQTTVSPSVGTSIGTLIDIVTEPRDGVIIQPPVFTDFKSLISASERTISKNPLRLTEDGYRIDFDDLESTAANPRNKMLILCNPHNPVGRVWTDAELQRVASICASNGVSVLADEIHSDLVIAPNAFHPFARAAEEVNVAWAAVHGPIKTFGLAGVCDTLLVTNDDDIAEQFQVRSSRYHLTRNNVFGLTAFEAAYRTGGPWLDDFLDLLAENVRVLERDLPDEIELIRPEGTYLAWLDLRQLDLEVAEIPGWIADRAGLAISPGHWFGREGAGFARITIAVPTNVVERAAAQLSAAVVR